MGKVADVAAVREGRIGKVASLDSVPATQRDAAVAVTPPLLSGGEDKVEEKTRRLLPYPPCLPCL